MGEYAMLERVRQAERAAPGCQRCGEPHGVSVPCGFRRAAPGLCGHVDPAFFKRVAAMGLTAKPCALPDGHGWMHVYECVR